MTTMSAILGDVGLVVTGAFGWAGDAVDFIVSSPLVLLMFVIPVAGIGISFVKRLMN